MGKVDAASRELGISVKEVAEGRQFLGIEGNLLDDIAPPPTWEFTPIDNENGASQN